MHCVHADRRARRLSPLRRAGPRLGHRRAVSDSERDITVGGVGSVPAHLFDGVDYAALGHLHGAAGAAGGVCATAARRLPYSFSEAAHRKGSWLVELDAAGLQRVEKVEAPVPRRLSTVRGHGGRAARRARARRGRRTDFLSVVLTDPARPEDAMNRLRRRFPHVLVLDWQPEGGVADDRSYRARVRGRSDVEVAEGFVAHVRRTRPSPSAERALLSEALADGARAEAAA